MFNFLNQKINTTSEKDLIKLIDKIFVILIKIGDEENLPLEEGLF